MARKFSWRQGSSALALCFAFSVSADYLIAQDAPTLPRSSRRAGPTEAAPAKPAEIRLEGINLDQPNGSASAEETRPAAPEKDDSTVAEAGTGEIELIQERYPNGAIKIEREVTQDAEGNYIRHGAWTMYDTSGNVMARGRFQNDERHGTWTRIYTGTESPIFGETPYKEFKGPYLSQITFDNGRPNGKWIIADAKQHKISEIHYEDGKRNGLATWWYMNGSKMQEILYRDGLIEGEFQQWAPDAQLISSESYQGGRKVAPKVAFYANGQKRLEETYLSAPVTIEHPDDWWNARFAVFAELGKECKHGVSTSWHENGQKKSYGTYQNNLPEGKFTWWYPNGQKSMEGTYQGGKPNGLWTWWHPNGQKATRGEYKDGAPIGKWYWWKDDGKVAQNADVLEGEQIVGEIPLPAAETANLPEEPVQAPSILKR